MATRMRVVADAKGPRSIPKAWLSADVVSERRRRRVVDLELSKADILQRELRLPKNAARRLDAMAALDLRQNTPFKPDDVYTQLGASRVEGDVIVAPQWVVKRRDANYWRKSLAKRGFLVRGLYVEGQRSALADFSSDLAPHAGKVLALNALLASMIVSILVASWLRPAAEAQYQLADLKDEREHFLAEAKALRSQLEKLRQNEIAQTEFLEKVYGRALVVETMRTVTEILPDDVWLDSATFSRGRLLISGETKKTAAELVLELDTEPNLARPQLSGPVSRTSSGAERFQITLDLVEGL